VLSVDQGGVAELVSRSGAGRLYPRDDSAALAEAAVDLLQGDLGDLGARGRAHAVAHHSWPLVFDRIFEVYRRLLE
jgi:glycosyltransferase involved in cell wall biosynthesis